VIDHGLHGGLQRGAVDRAFKIVIAVWVILTEIGTDFLIAEDYPGIGAATNNFTDNGGDP
jgi:hypothetical protein